MPLPEQWTNGSWAAVSTRTQPSCSLSHKARLRLALHYWVGWNALADAIADYSLPIEGITAEKVHEVWCGLCESRITGRSVLAAKKAPCVCSVPKRRSGDLRGEESGSAQSTKVVPRHHHGNASGGPVLAANLTWQELRSIDPVWSTRAQEAARRYGYGFTSWIRHAMYSPSHSPYSRSQARTERSPLSPTSAGVPQQGSR